MTKKPSEQTQTMSATVDAELRIPLYHQIFLILVAKISDGEYEDGQLLPSETELASMFGVSRITATRVFRELAEAGLVTRGRGRGTRVKYDGGRTIVRGDVQGLIESRHINSRAGTQRVLVFEYVKASREVATALRLPAGSVVQKAVRVMQRNGLPFSHLTTYVPQAVGQHWTQEDLEQKSLLSLLESAGATLKRGEQRITAILADGQMGPTLLVPVGSPLLSVVRTTFTTNDVPIEYLVALYPPDRYQIFMSLDDSELPGRTAEPGLPPTAR